MTGPADSTITGPVGGDASAGTLLRRAREKQGTHIAALAAAIKVAPRKLELLEADRFDELPDPSFTRALAQTVCRALKIDSAPVLALLPQASDRPLEAVGRGINAPFRERSARMPGSDRPLWLRVGFWLPIVVIAIAAALYFMPNRLISTLSMPHGAASAVAPAASAPRVVTEPVAPVPAASAPLVTTIPSAPPASAPAALAAPAPTMAADVATPPPSTLQLRASEPSWIEVQDSGGRLLISRVIEPGESVDLDGTLPLKLRVGNAMATQVIFRGQPVDLARHTRENIARLDLK